MSCHRNKHHEGDPTDCTERTSNAVVPSARSMWKAQLPPRGCKFQYLHLFSFTSSTRRCTAFPDGQRVAKHIQSSSSLTYSGYCLRRHLTSRHHSPFQLQSPAYFVLHPVHRVGKILLFIADFHRSQVNASRTRAQSSSFFNRSTPELYSRVIYLIAPVALATRE